MRVQKNCYSIFVIFTVLLIQLSLCLPVDDKDFKPVLADPNKKVLPANTDDYEVLRVPIKEESPIAPSKPISPQTGSLLSLEVVNTPIVEIPVNFSSTGLQKPDQNTPFPVKYNGNGGDLSSYAYKASNDEVAPPPIVDPKNKDLSGIQPPNVVFSRPEDFHPMEVVTPLVDNFPCDPDRIIKVAIPAATFENNKTVPYLPARFGCSSASDGSREKVSPSVSWTNIAQDVFDFSLQVIELGDDCSAKGPDFGRILWHVEGIKASATVTLQEGASHDSRLLFGGKELPNQWLEEYYSGPCPARGTTGCYRFKVLGHRASGTCQCGSADVLFVRPAKPEEWKYETPVLAAPTQKKN
eukprot:c12216_g1_i1.p1 GENE.c12216_g1_i1~~c12216_g1_i1.p1  ORF type:complete len:354 (+),score=187.63 c12216_g1_i1:42-1103(+)